MPPNYIENIHFLYKSDISQIKIAIAQLSSSVKFSRGQENFTPIYFCQIA
ncbi:MAG: hypothetical protein O4859_01290 [Trichodesmium sp. St18_bin1]|nr:hypothetical protein [Trichodesmium sp. St18_bin1]